MTVRCCGHETPAPTRPARLRLTPPFLPLAAACAESLVWPASAQAEPRPHFDPAAYPAELGFDFMTVKLEDVFDAEADGPAGVPVSSGGTAPQEPREVLLQMLASLKTAAAKEDLLRILRQV